MSVGTYLTHSALAQLPTLIRKQRRLEAIVAAVAQDEIDEKAVRAEIDALLRAAGLQAGDSVSCAGYDVTHHVRKGRASLNTDKLVEQLVRAGVDRALVEQLVVDCTDTGDPSTWATVRPMKGAKVRVAV